MGFAWVSSANCEAPFDWEKELILPEEWSGSVVISMKDSLGEAVMWSTRGVIRVPARG